MRPTSVLSVLLLVACGNTGPLPSAAPTWHQDVAPIAAQNCATCHNPTGIAGFLDLGDYDEAAAYAASIQQKVEALEMPPFLAADTPECPNEWGFLHDRRLSDSDRNTLSAWVEAGTPEGDPHTAAALIAPDVQHLTRVDDTLAPDAGFTTQPSSVLTDEFQCLIFDPKLTETRWVEAFEVRPDNIKVMHHAVINVATRDEAAALDAADGTVDGTYPCFGGAEVSGVFMGGWVPGSGPTTYPTGSGLALSPDQVMVSQMHYHNISTAEYDATTLDIQWALTEPDVAIYMELIGNASTEAEGLLPGPNDAAGTEFRIPAGVAGHTETSRHDLGIPEGQSYSPFIVAPHMHLIGVSLRAWIEHADGSLGPCLVHVPAWDFDWQLFYFYDAEIDNAPVVQSGDSLVIECTYDNSLKNGALVSALNQQGLSEPIDVRLGQGSLDEMCLVAVGAIPRP